MYTKALITTLALGTAFSARCVPDEFPQNASLELETFSGPQLGVNGNTVEASPVQGSVEIIDGCTFRVSGFTFTPTSSNTRWYGRRANDGNSSAGIQISDGEVSASQGGNSAVFQLTTEAGREASYRDFDIFEIFDTTNEVILATAGPIPSFSAGSSSSNNPSSSTGRNTTTNSTKTNNNGGRTGSSSGSERSTQLLSTTIIIASIGLVASML